MRLGKNYRFFTKLGTLFKRFIIPELMDDVRNEQDMESAVRLIDLLNDVPDVGKDVLSSLAEIQMELLKQNETLQKLLPEGEVNKD